MSSKRLTPDAWQRHITSWQQSGLSQKAYCQQHLLGTVKNWKHTYKAEMPHTLDLGFMRAVKNDASSLAELMALQTP